MYLNIYTYISHLYDMITSLSSSIQPEKPTTSIYSEELSKNASDFFFLPWLYK